MKTLNSIFGLLLVTLLTMPFHSCQSQIKFNSAEQEADSLAIQMNSTNELIKAEWIKTINLFNKRNTFAEELIHNVDKSTIHATVETKKLSSSLHNFKSINVSEELLINEELFHVLHLQKDDISQKIYEVYSVAENRKIDNSSFEEIQLKLESIENRITIQIRQFNQEVEAYNNKIIKDANDIFYKKYPHLGIKCYFKPSADAQKAPIVNF